jgi:hypothetical protein
MNPAAKRTLPVGLWPDCWSGSGLRGCCFGPRACCAGS